MIDHSDQPSTGRTGDRLWRGTLVRAGLVYLFSRLCVIVGAAVVAAELRADQNKVMADLPGAVFADPHYIDKAISKSAVPLMADVLTSWDGQWYQRIVSDGYPRVVPAHVTYLIPEARAAFFPAYPMLVRVLDNIIPGGVTTAALLINFVLGAAAVLLVGLLARQLYGVAIAEKAMVLTALFPGAFVLSFAYTEALLITVAAGCLWCLHHQRWWWAGILASIGSATRPNGVALAAACAVAAFIAIRRRREWIALVAPAIAPLGLLGFQYWLGHHTGEQGVWLRVQTEAWGEGTSFGMTAVKNSFRAFAHPLTSPTATITAVSIVVLAVMVWFAWKKRLPPEMVTYCAVVIALMLLPSTVTARPRFLYTAFPLLISAAAWLHTNTKRDLWPYVISACAAGLVGLTALYGVLGAIP